MINGACTPLTCAAPRLADEARRQVDGEQNQDRPARFRAN